MTVPEKYKVHPLAPWYDQIVDAVDHGNVILSQRSKRIEELEEQIRELRKELYKAQGNVRPDDLKDKVPETIARLMGSASPMTAATYSAETLLDSGLTWLFHGNHSNHAREMLELLTGTDSDKVKEYDKLMAKFKSVPDQTAAYLAYKGFTLKWANVLPVRYWGSFPDAALQLMSGGDKDFKLYKELGKNLTNAVIEDPTLLPDIRKVGAAKLKPVFARCKNLKLATFCVVNDIDLKYVRKFTNNLFNPRDEQLALALACHNEGITAEEGLQRARRIRALGISWVDIPGFVDDEMWWGNDGWDNSEVLMNVNREERNFFKWHYRGGAEHFHQFLCNNKDFMELLRATELMSELSDKERELRISRKESELLQVPGIQKQLVDLGRERDRLMGLLKSQGCDFAYNWRADLRRFIDNPTGQRTYGSGGYATEYSNYVEAGRSLGIA